MGHSPFLHVPKQRWVDLSDPAARARVEEPQLLGAVLKLDFSAMKQGFEAARGHWKRPEGKRGEKLKAAVESFGDGAASE